MGAKAPVKDYGLHSCTKGHEPAGSGQIKDPWVHLEVYGCLLHGDWPQKPGPQKYTQKNWLPPTLANTFHFAIYHVRIGHSRFRKQIWVQILFLICGGLGLDVLILKEIQL
jgi:hypothetical protein